MAPKPTMTIRISPKLLAQIAAAAKADNRTLSNWVQIALARALSEQALKPKEKSTHG